MNLKSTVSLSISIAVVAFTAACSQPEPASNRPAEKQAATPAPTPGEPQGATAGKDLAATTPPPAPPVAPAPAAGAPGAPAARGAEAPGRSGSSPAEKPAPSGVPETAPTTGSTAVTKPVEPPRPTFREVTIPSGTSFALTLVTPLASDKSKVEDEVRASLAKPIVIEGVTAVPAGAKFIGSVIEAKQSGRVKGRASLSFRFDRLIVGDESHEISTALMSQEAGSSAKQDAKKGAIGAGAGAVVGGIVGGGKGAAIGAGVGGAGAVVGTRGVELKLLAGTAISAQLSDPLTMRVRIDDK